MNILEQCRIWNENDEYQKIIDALEAILAEKYQIRQQKLKKLKRRRRWTASWRGRTTI